MTDNAATPVPNDVLVTENIGGQDAPNEPEFGRIGMPVTGSYNLGLTPLHAPYKMVLRISNGITFLPVLTGLIVLDVVFASQDIFPFGGLTAIGCLFWLAIVIILPARIYRRWGYAMEADRLRVLRGFLFRTDTVVPFNRIQHIDVSQGPIERLNNVSRLIVHTAGTHNSVVVLPGLEPGEADAMREEIRSHIREEMI
jgi:membrane protein YdbS with pleckstrin-like domain